jgi:hypothetical protein
MIPKEISCDANPGWEKDDRFTFTTLTFKPTDLLSGESLELPDIFFRHVSEFSGSGFNKSLCSIMTRAKDSPADVVAFNLAFITVSTNGEPLMPIAAPSKNVGGNAVFDIPQQLVARMKK